MRFLNEWLAVAPCKPFCGMVGAQVDINDFMAEGHGS
jgi:hypothetical protein